MVESITREQYWELVGILTASRQHEKIQDQLYEVWKAITGDEDWFWDASIERNESVESRVKDILKSLRIVVTGDSS